MTTKTWSFTLEGQAHTLTLEHGVFSGKRTILLDGQLLEHISRNLLDSGSFHEYEVDGHSVVVVIQSKIASFTYDLLVDDISVDTGRRGPQQVGNTPLKNTFIMAAFIFCVGLGVSWIMKNDYDRQLAIQEWPVVTGSISYVDAARYESSDDDSTDIYYYPVLDIKYAVNDTPLTVRLEDTDRSYDTDFQARTAHSVGERQKLYVNPANPQEAEIYFERLDPNGWVSTSLIIMAMFTIFPLIIIGAVWFQTRKRYSVREAFQ